MPLEYGHDRAALLKKAQEARQAHNLAYPSGKDHYLLPNGQQINPHRRHESKKARLRRRRLEREQPPVRTISFPIVPTIPPDKPV